MVVNLGEFPSEGGWIPESGLKVVSYALSDHRNLFRKVRKVKTNLEEVHVNIPSFPTKVIRSGFCFLGYLEHLFPQRDKPRLVSFSCCSPRRRGQRLQARSTGCWSCSWSCACISWKFHYTKLLLGSFKQHNYSSNWFLSLFDCLCCHAPLFFAFFTQPQTCRLTTFANFAVSLANSTNFTGFERTENQHERGPE